MKVLVAIQSAVGSRSGVRVGAKSFIEEPGNPRIIMNSSCKRAIEQAVGLKKNHLAGEIVAISIGTTAARDQLHAALAHGADRAVLIDTEKKLNSLAIAKVLQALVERESPQLVIVGMRDINDDHNPIGQMLAALCNYSQGIRVLTMELVANKVDVTCRIDVGLQRLSLKLPAVITCDQKIIKNRHATVPNIITTWQKPLEIMLLSDLKVPTNSTFINLKIEFPEALDPELETNLMIELLGKNQQDSR